MKVAQKHIFLVSLFLVICLACKKEMPLRSDFELSANLEDNKVVLNWSPVLLSGFKSINVYRSVSPIHDPQFNKPIDAGLLVGTINNRTITTFRDSGLILGSGGEVYYKIVLNLDNRMIPSNETQVSLEGFSFTYNTFGSNSSGEVTPFPEKNLLYISTNNIGVLRVIDYSQKKLLKTISFTQYGPLCPMMNAGKAELFAQSDYKTVTCYDALTLTTKYSISIPSGSIREFSVKDDYLYIMLVSNNSAKILTYDLFNKNDSKR